MTTTTAEPTYGPDYTADQESAAVIASMLTEPTGRHFLDSGSAYGRHWERNQGMTLEQWNASPEITATPADYGYGPDVTLSLFHWLDDRLSYEPKWQRRFEVWTAIHETGCETGYDGECGCSWFTLVELFADCYAESRYGYAGDMDRGTVNSYNGENALSQDVQFSWFTSRNTGETIVMLQVHGGCDVRGGYTAPKAFSPRGYDGVYDLFDMDSYGFACCPPDYTPPQPDTLDGMPDRPATPIHSYYHRAGEWTDSDGSPLSTPSGSYTADPWEAAGAPSYAETADGEPYTPCPVCGAPVEFYAMGV